MTKYRYIHHSKTLNQVVCTTSPVEMKLSSTCILVEEEDTSYDLHIKYIDCCRFEDGKIKVDTVKALSNKIVEMEQAIHYHLGILRKLLTEAMAMGNREVLEDIKSSIEAVKGIREQDLSFLDTLEKIDKMSIPELNIDYEEAYGTQLFG